MQLLRNSRGDLRGHPVLLAMRGLGPILSDNQRLYSNIVLWRAKFYRGDDGKPAQLL
jgi:hypothetical protein